MIILFCAGLDEVRRGYETHTRLLFNQLKLDNLDVRLVKRSGQKSDMELIINSSSRNSILCRIASKFYGTTWGNESKLFAVLWIVLNGIYYREKASVYYVIEPEVSKIFWRFKRLLVGSPKLIYVHGVSRDPNIYMRYADVVQEVSMLNYKKALGLKNIFRTDLHLLPHFLPAIIPSIPDTVDSQVLRWFGATGAKKILVVGAMAKSKGTDIILESVLQLNESRILFLTQSVEDSLKEDVRNISARQDIKIHGTSNTRIFNFYVEADLLVFPSKKEGFGMVLIEAMSCGLAVLAHDNEHFRWILKDSSSLIDMSHAAILAEKINSLTHHNLAKMGEYNRQTFQRNFAWSHLRKEYLSLLDVK